MTKETFDYDIECEDEINFKLVITFKRENRLFKKIFDKSKTKLQRTKNIKVDGTVEEIDEFLAIDRFLPLIKVYMGKPFRIVNEITQKDGISLINYNVTETRYKRVGDVWDIIVSLRGEYVKC